MSGWGTLTFDSGDLTQIATNYEKGIHVSATAQTRPHMHATNDVAIQRVLHRAPSHCLHHVSLSGQVHLCHKASDAP